MKESDDDDEDEDDDEDDEDEDEWARLHGLSITSPVSVSGNNFEYRMLCVPSHLYNQYCQYMLMDVIVHLFLTLISSENNRKH